MRFTWIPYQVQSQPGIHSEALRAETQSVGDIVQSELECLPKHIFLDKKRIHKRM